MEGVVHKIYYCDEKLGRCENTIYAQENIENSINSSVASTKYYWAKIMCCNHGRTEGSY